jgi:hypothetical protein
MGMRSENNKWAGILLRREATELLFEKMGEKQVPHPVQKANGVRNDTFWGF